MRPVARGDVPVDDNGNPVTYADYKDARDDLIERMGDFCSYCEVALHSAVDVGLAQQTLELTGLNRVPGHPNLSDRDRRWKKRFEAWSIALIAHDNLQVADSDEMRETIILLAKGFGFWSVWLAVFSNDLDMKKRLIVGFPGTLTDCFDDHGDLVARPGGAI